MPKSIVDVKKSQLQILVILFFIKNTNKQLVLKQHQC